MDGVGITLSQRSDWPNFHYLIVKTALIILHLFSKQENEIEVLNIFATWSKSKRRIKEIFGSFIFELLFA